MRSTIFLGAAAALALIASDPAFCMQTPPPTDPVPPTPPAPPTEPVPAPAPAPGEPAPPPAPAPVPEPAPAPTPPVQGSTNAPSGPMATPPASSEDTATSGGTTTAGMQPVAATKESPPCSKTVQDSCRNPGEGPKRAKKPR